METPEARSSSAERSGWGPKPPRSPRHQVASAPRRAMSASVARSARWLLYTPPKTASLISTVPARHAGEIAGVAGAVAEGERAERLIEPVAHAPDRLVHEQRAHVDAAARHGAAARALEPVRIERGGGEPGERLGRLVAAAPRGLAPELEHRQHLEPRALDAEAAQQLEVALAELERVGVVELGHGHDREQPHRREPPDPLERPLEAAGAAQAVVVGGAPAVEAHANLERIARRIAQAAQRGGARHGEQGAVGEHGHGAVG